MKNLLLTSDDFGMCHAVNEGITLAMTKGICASTNFLAPTPWFHEAVALAKEHKLEVGVHLCLGSDWDYLRWSPITDNPRLSDGEGRLPPRPEDLEAMGATDADIYDELKAQIKLVQKAYGQPTHLDSHMIGGEWKTPFLSRVQAVIQKLCGEFGLLSTYTRDQATGKLRHFVEEDCQSGWDLAGFEKRLAGWTAPGNYHLFGHAAIDSPELWAMCSPGHPSRVWAGEVRVKDMALYMAPGLRDRIEKLGFTLVKVGQALHA